MSRKQAACLILLLLLAVVKQTATVHNRGSAEQSHLQQIGHYTGQQVIEMSQPVVANLLPQEASLNFTAENQVYTLRDGGIDHDWSVDCRDARHRSMIHLIWNADTGQLREVGCDCPSPLHSASSVRLSPQAAVEKARDWLGLLGFPETWSAAAPPRRNSSNWVVLLQGDRRKAMVTILGSDGRLAYATIGERR
jgi:hypothetical protein